LIQVHPADQRYSADHGWLKSNFSFSFADYYDPNNTEFGPLRVLNDDIVAPQRGFGAHPHREMEIVSIVLRGELKHEDSTGHSAVTTFGGVQRMTAGTGIIHSEVNPGDDEVAFLQLWFTPDTRGLEPSYETTQYEPDQLTNRLLPIVAKSGGNGIASIHQDLTLYLSKLEAGKALTFTQPEGRRIYVHVLEGDLQLNDSTSLKTRDAARITQTPELTLHSADGAFFMLIDLP
jgi:quercetin 2,3-dioxygenase